MAKGRIVVVRPEDDLLKIIAGELSARGGGAGGFTVILPNRRSGLFLKYRLSRELDNPSLLPAIFSLDEWIVHLYLKKHGMPGELIDDFDASWFVFKAYQEVTSRDEGPGAGWDRFFPWAGHILDCFNEFDMELVTPKNLVLELAEEGKAAGKILSLLGDLYRSFNEQMSEKGFKTLPGLFREIARDPAGFLGGDHTSTMIAGFYALTRCEETIFFHLFKEGATFYWHCKKDPLPELYERWRARWKAELHEAAGEDPAPRATTYSFYEAHDLHSQLKELKKRVHALAPDPAPDRCCIVPLVPSSLVPLLYHLPERPFNLTMGYPIRLTGPYGFFELCLTLLEHSRDHCFRQKDMVELLLHPYSGLDPAMVDEIRSSGAPYMGLDELVVLAGRYNCKARMELLKEDVLLPMYCAKTPYELGEAVEKGVAFMKHGIGLHHLQHEINDMKPWDALAGMDVMALSYLETEVAAILKEGLFSQERMQGKALYDFFREISNKYRIPFEGEPLSGTQIMGLLETRLINFDHVFILDANDSVMPGTEEVNPILPRGLRPVLGLPKREREELILKHHFERCIQGAKNAHIFWREQLDASSGGSELEGKSVKSRFVESILWELESVGHNLEEEGLLLRSEVNLTPGEKGKGPGIKKEEAHLRRLKEKLSHLSPTSIETYLKCPKRFFYRYILELEAETATEEVHYDEIGTAVHEALEQYYRELTREKDVVRRDELSPDELFDHFWDRLEKRPFFKNLSGERRFLLEQGARYRLKRYVEHQPHETRICALERKISIEFPMRETGCTARFYGKIDRIDLRDGIYTVLDYKTGSVDMVPVQLPLYAYMLCLNGLDGLEKDWRNITCAFIDLRKDGEEKFLVSPRDLEKTGFGTWLRDEFPCCLQDILHQMVASGTWYPARDVGVCKFCEYRNGCMDCGF